jgi:GNAT superfamily N-acetyltransferase
MLVVRHAAAEDLAVYVGLWNAVWPNLARDVAELERDDATLPEPMRALRWIATLDGMPVGFAEAYRPASYFHPRKWMLHVGVLAAYRRRGVGTALYDAAWAQVAELGADTVSTQVREDDQASITFADQRGLVELNRDFESLLDLQAVDPGQMVRLAERMPPNLTLLSFSELDKGDFRMEFHRLFEVVRQDIPRPEPPVPLTFEFFQEQVIEDPFFLRDGTFFAIHGEEPIGFSGIYQGTNDGWVDQWLTAVRRDWRGRGIAQALKAKIILWSRANGYRTLRTDNSSLNAPILTVNESLGFQRSAAIITMRRHLDLVR